MTQFLAATNLKLINQEKEKEQTSCWTPAVHGLHLHLTTVTAIASQSICDAPVLRLSISTKNEETKKPGRSYRNT